jgi:hypothetical protein
MNRDELGRFASASSAQNGGGANFAQPAELPSTRDALLKHATSAPSKAPTMTGGTPQIAPPPDYDKAFHAVMAGHTGMDIGSSVHNAVNGFAEQFSSHEPAPFPPMNFPGEESAGNMPSDDGGWGANGD